MSQSRFSPQSERRWSPFQMRLRLSRFDPSKIQTVVYSQSDGSGAIFPELEFGIQYEKSAFGK